MQGTSSTSSSPRGQNGGVQQLGIPRSDRGSGESNGVSYVVPNNEIAVRRVFFGEGRLGGSRLVFDYEAGTLSHIDNGVRKVLSNAAVSGPHGKGRLPDGLYTMGKMVAVTSTTGKWAGFCSPDAECWFQKLFHEDEGRVGFGRGNFGMHFDGVTNGSPPGTLGCIGITDCPTKSDLRQFLIDHQHLKLEVVNSGGRRD